MSEVCLGRRGETEEGWISSFFFFSFFNLKEDVQRKMIQIDFSNKVVLRNCEHMDLQDGHG